jgi:predicted  nucleic acid-binding Zn-ribbon protein
MTEQRRTDLKELQKLDLRIHEARKRIGNFDPRLEEVEEPALILERDLGTTRTRLQEMKLEERRLELGTEEKRVRQKKLDERLGSVRNLREEAAVSAELEMVKRSLQNDEQEALTLIDQIRKMEERAAELEAAYAEASELVEPKRNELLEQRAEAQKQLDSLRAERESFAAGMDPQELKTYDAIRAGGRSVAVATLTADGACSHCFGMVPLQVQNEIRHGNGLIRCEGCGVILTALGPEDEEQATASEADAGAAMESPEGTAVGGEEEVDEAELEPAVAGADGGVAEDDGDEDSNTE